MKVSGSTCIYGIIGDPIEHTFSPLMHNAAFGALGIDGVYVAFNVKSEELENAVKSLVSLGIKGINVTVPHKSRIMQYLGKVSPEAEVIGAVNTILVADGITEGYNTDVYGFISSVAGDGGMDKLPERICVIGAGGASRGVVYSLCMRKEVNEIVILNRNVSRAESLADEFETVSSKKIYAYPLDVDHRKKCIPVAGMVVNTTSIGMYPVIDETPVPERNLFCAGQIVCDIVYNPVRTKLLKDAESCGAKIIDGLGMLVHQGAKAFEMWTGRKAPLEIMRNVLIEKFNG